MPSGPAQQQTEQFGAANPNPPRPAPPPPPTPPAAPTNRPGAPDAEPAPVKKKRRLRDPLSILLVLIIVVSLLVAGLIGAELYVRNQANNKVAEAVACEVKDKATAKFGVAPLVLWQIATQHFTNISVQTAGNQIRDAKGMKIKLTIDNVQLKDTGNSKGTIGALNADITWTSDGIKESVQNAIPILGPFVTNSVVTSPADGTVELKGMLNDIKAKPVVSGNGLQLQIIDFNTLGLHAAQGDRPVDTGRVPLQPDQKFPAGHSRGQRAGHLDRCAEPLLDPERHHPRRRHHGSLLRQYLSE